MTVPLRADSHCDGKLLHTVCELATACGIVQIASDRRRKGRLTKAESVGKVYLADSGRWPAGKILNMLAAAASDATQKLLLLATESSWKNYWSSGGVLPSEEVFQRLRIPLNQILLGAIFLFPEDSRDAAVKPGGLRIEKAISLSGLDG